jgi:hypothetical protein
MARTSKASSSQPASWKLVRQVQHCFDDALQDSFPVSDPVSFLQISPVKEGDRPLFTVKVNGKAATSRAKRSAP